MNQNIRISNLIEGRQGKISIQAVILLSRKEYMNNKNHLK